MERKRRLRLLLILVPALLSLAVAGLAAWSFLSGSLERRVEREWPARGHAGSLSIGRIRITGSDQVTVSEVAISAPGLFGGTLVRADRVVLRMDWLRAAATEVRIEGVAGELTDAQRYRFLMGIIRSEAQRKPAGQPMPVRIDAAGRVVLPRGIELAGLHVAVAATGPEAQVTALAELQGRPLRLELSSQRSPNGPVLTRIEATQATIPVPELALALADLGILPDGPPAQALALMPAAADASGTVVTVDAEAEAAHGSITAAWPEGSLKAELQLDRHRLRLERLHLADARLANLRGRLQVALAGGEAVLEATSWRPGPALPLPAGMPVDEILQALPALRLRAGRSLGDGVAAVVRLHDEQESRIDIALGSDRIRIDGAQLPLTLARSWLPPGLALTGGLASTLSLRVDAGTVRDIAIDVRQARGSYGGWSFGPLDGACSVLPLADGASVTLALGQAKAQITARAAGTTIEASTPAVETLLARLHGPVALPRMAGAARLKLTAAPDGAGARLTVDELALERASFSDPGARGDRLRAIDARLEGVVSVQPDILRIDARGRLTAGELRLVDAWQRIAVQRPAVRLALDVASGATTTLTLRELSARATDAQDRPLDGGWSLSAAGALDLRSDAPPTGRIDGVLDRVDLGWLAGRVPDLPVAVRGTGAAAFSVAIRPDALAITGAVLPLGADIDLGVVRIEGLQGAVRFAWTEHPVEDPKP